jgi:hypothetical protein
LTFSYQRRLIKGKKNKQRRLFQFLSPVPCSLFPVPFIFTILLLTACADPTPSARNPENPTGPPTTGGASACATGASVTPISDVQGEGEDSPFIDENVTIEGVVTADLQERNQLQGFFIQAPNGDGNDATSDGVFVHSHGAGDVGVGDIVQVTGKVIEFNQLTELTDVADVQVCGSGEQIEPVTLDLPFASLEEWERYEGMLVTIPEPLTVSQNFFQGRYGQITLSEDGRPATNDERRRTKGTIKEKIPWHNRGAFLHTLRRFALLLLPDICYAKTRSDCHTIRVMNEATTHRLSPVYHFVTACYLLRVVSCFVAHLPVTLSPCHLVILSPCHQPNVSPSSNLCNTRCALRAIQSASRSSASSRSRPLIFLIRSRR